YFLALVLFTPDQSPLRQQGVALPSSDTAPGRSAALLSALCLATGILYTRSSRIGELDILLVPCVTIAAIGILLSWRSQRLHGRAHWPGMVLATLAATAAVMTKGPPGLAMVALGPYGGIALWAAFSRDPFGDSEAGCHGRASRLWTFLSI